MPMQSSELIRKAKEMILSVKGKTLSLDERKDKAIELAALMLTEAKRIETAKEKKIQSRLAKMMEDEKGKSFLIGMMKTAFRFIACMAKPEDRLKRCSKISIF
jgi:RHH-type proline utilization regulon transcriptional repressor/proline dehydrogenase/delta 1-pyrroline-5-carboxylate dehydrogenase